MGSDPPRTREQPRWPGAGSSLCTEQPTSSKPRDRDVSGQNDDWAPAGLGQLAPPHLATRRQGHQGGRRSLPKRCEIAPFVRLVDCAPGMRLRSWRRPRRSGDGRARLKCFVDQGGIGDVGSDRSSAVEKSLLTVVLKRMRLMPQLCHTRAAAELPPFLCADAL